MLVKGYKPPVINLEDMLRTQRAAWRLGLTENNEQRVGRLDGITDSMGMSLSKLGVGDGQGSLACCSPWGRKESDMTEQWNGTEFNKH